MKTAAPATELQQSVAFDATVTASRRQCLGMLASVPLLCASAPLAHCASNSLGALAAEKGILFGASLAVHELDRPHGPRYAAVYENDARILTSELEFKMSTLRPSEDRLEFATADRFVDFAMRRRMLMRGHTLIWNDDLPQWIKTLPASAVERLIETHIMTMLERYRDRVAIWDVVNEPIGPWDNNPGNLRGGPYFAALGEDYIHRAFTLARKFGPKATLVLNEAQTETADGNGAIFRVSLLDLLRRLKDKGTPIDAVGIESHLKAKAEYDFPAFSEFLNDIAELGFQIHITELDVNDAGIAGPISARDGKVAEIYEGYLSAVLEVPAVRVVQTWQMIDSTSWMRDPATAAALGFRDKSRPLLYDDAFRRKPAWDAVARAFRNAPDREAPPQAE